MWEGKIGLVEVDLPYSKAEWKCDPGIEKQCVLKIEEEEELPQGEQGWHI